MRGAKNLKGLGEIDYAPVVEVAVSALSVADSPRVSGESTEHIQMLAAMDEDLPPIIVHRATMRVIDGMHRLQVAKVNGQKTISVKFFDGGAADAFVLAVKANIAHGLPLSLADRKRAVERVIRSHPQWSARMIASIAGVSPGTVAEIRKQALGAPDAGDVRIGRDGRVRPVDGVEGRRAAIHLMHENPDLSLRQVARSAGVSPETVRSLKKRLNHGQNPVEPEAGPQNPSTERPAHAARGGQENPKVSPLKGANRRKILERLKADPALRFNEAGRDLLRLLQILTITSRGWAGLAESVPLHSRDMVAQLAGECAEVWTEFAAAVVQPTTRVAEPQPSHKQSR